MPTYPSSEALLQDAELRIDRYGADHGIIVVEGPDDKRLLCTKTVHQGQIITTGGKVFLLEAHRVAAERKIDSVVFLTDCDYEVGHGELSAQLNLIISKNADIESDLLENGGFKRLVVELVAAALDSEEAAESIAREVEDRSVAIAEVIGRLRIVARTHGFEIDTDIKYRKYRQRHTATVDEEKLIRTVIQGSPDCAMKSEEVKEIVSKLPRHYHNCNGHDLVAATNHVLRDDYGVRNETPESLERLLRTSTPKSVFEELDVARYLRRWEQQHKRKILDTN
ncbi:toprim domain-containing protein [Mycobacteroides abscessus]|uniref:hypothetical protein n=1 Tax=Mycobacteroides abscessus TaxID=36809 RepID=UPI0012FFFB7D|nr:hypothetical protein [Mycobacteroides abscessus]